MHALSHRRIRRALSSYADGELQGAPRDTVSAHVGRCAACRRDLEVVRAIKDSLRRSTAGAPPALAGLRMRRWSRRLAGEAQGVAAGRPGLRPPRNSSRNPVGVLVATPRPGARAGALAGVVAVLILAGGVVAFRENPVRDPNAVKALVELARLEASTPVPLAEATAGPGAQGMFELGDQQVSLIHGLFDGVEVFAAVSDRAFPMPDDARPMGHGRGAPWVVERGDVFVACVSRPAHILVVGALPAERLVEAAAGLGAS